MRKKAFSTSRVFCIKSPCRFNDDFGSFYKDAIGVKKYFCVNIYRRKIST